MSPICRKFGVDILRNTWSHLLDSNQLMNEYHILKLGTIKAKIQSKSLCHFCIFNTSSITSRPLIQWFGLLLVPSCKMNIGRAPTHRHWYSLLQFMMQVCGVVFYGSRTPEDYLFSVHSICSERKWQIMPFSKTKNQRLC